MIEMRPVRGPLSNFFKRAYASQNRRFISGFSIIDSTITHGLYSELLESPLSLDLLREGVKTNLGARGCKGVQGLPRFSKLSFPAEPVYTFRLHW
jgi:hypothetical protein